jgi:predicted SAM-dependent methyltransferase
MNELKVQFGSGGNILKGWRNHDLESDGVDIRKPLPYADNTVDFILAEHVMEHVTGPEALRFLDECYRILKPGGTLRVCVPVLDHLDHFQRRDIILNHGHQIVFTGSSLWEFIMSSKFLDDKMDKTERKDCDGHWRVIGELKDETETCRIEAMK